MVCYIPEPTMYGAYWLYTLFVLLCEKNWLKRTLNENKETMYICSMWHQSKYCSTLWNNRKLPCPKKEKTNARKRGKKKRQLNEWRIPKVLKTWQKSGWIVDFCPRSQRCFMSRNVPAFLMETMDTGGLQAQRAGMYETIKCHANTIEQYILAWWCFKVDTKNLLGSLKWILFYFIFCFLHHKVIIKFSFYSLPSFLLSLGLRLPITRIQDWCNNKQNTKHYGISPSGMQTNEMY